MTSKVVLLVVSVISAVTDGVHCNDRFLVDDVSVNELARQYDALLSIYHATEMSSTPFHNWFFDDQGTSDYCGFTGIICDDENFVTVLDLDHVGLTGTLPDSISDLSRLKHLRMYNNSLVGTLPDSLFYMTSLRHIQLGYNYLSGSFPDLSDLNLLSRLFLGKNAISGTLPLSLCSLTNLELIDISHVTKMWGHIPACFARLDLLSTFRVTDVGLIGTVPAELCRWGNMNELSPNPYGCDAVACPVGYFQRSVGRRTSESDICLPCDVPSNVIGSTICQWHDVQENTVEPTSAWSSPTVLSVTTPPTGTSANPSGSSYAPSKLPFAPPVAAPAPTSTKPIPYIDQLPSIEPSTSTSPTFGFSMSPTDESFSSSPSISTFLPSFVAATSFPSVKPMYLSSISPSDIPSCTPSSEPSLPVHMKQPTQLIFPPFSRPPLTFQPTSQESDNSSSRSVTKRGLLASATLLVAGAAILMYITLRKRSKPDRVRVAEETTELERKDMGPTLASPHMKPQLSRPLSRPVQTSQENIEVLFQSADGLSNFTASNEALLAPIPKRVPSILKTSIMREHTPDNDQGTYGSNDEQEQGRKVRFSVPESGNEERRQEREAWLTWLLNPMHYPINACGATDSNSITGIALDSAMVDPAGDTNSLNNSDVEDDNPLPPLSGDSILGIRGLSAKRPINAFKSREVAVAEIFRSKSSHSRPRPSLIYTIPGSYCDTEFGEV